MLSGEAIREAVDRIVRASRPSRVLLFGSYARGDVDADSDLDFLVVEPVVEDRHAEMGRLREAVGNVGIGVDVLVYSEAEVEERKDWCTSPVYWALREGRTLYASE